MPTNDFFTNATVVAGFPVTIAGDTTAATAEPGEPVFETFPRQSIWWKWTAPFTGRVGIADDGSVSGSYLKVFTGDQLASLTNLTSNILYLFNVLNVVEGTSYYFAADTTGNNGGSIRFGLVALPVNDDFANALPMLGDLAEAIGDNTFATLEPGEPQLSPGFQERSVWWRWQATRSGTMRVSVAGSAFSAYARIFTGNEITNLSLIAEASQYRDAEFTTIQGMTYQIRVIGSGFACGVARLTLYPPQPPNDVFTNRTGLTGCPLTAVGTTIGATAQPDEPLIGSFRLPTVWFSWTANTSGWCTLSATNLIGQPSPGFRVALFKGAKLAKLKKIATGQDRTGALVTNGQTYIIGVDGSAGDFRLGLNVIPAPPNDYFSNRIVLGELRIGATNDNRGATLEKGEPVPMAGLAKASMWYSWRSPADGQAQITAAGNGFTPLVTVYRGKAVNALKIVTNSVLSDGIYRGIASFPAKVGTHYEIRIDGRSATSRELAHVEADLTTLKLTNPTNRAIISAAAPPSFQVSTPLASVDGTLQSVNYIARQTNGASRSIGLSSTFPYTIVPTNLPAGSITIYAVATNSDGVQRIAPPVHIQVRPANDDFSQRFWLQGYEWTASGTTAGATKEAGEPSHGSSAATASVWWSWAAPASGKVVLSSSLDGLSMALYTGSQVNALKRVPWTITPLGFSFNSVAGTTYHLAVNARSPYLEDRFWPISLNGRLTTVSFAEPVDAVYTEPVDLPLSISTSESNALIQRVDFYASESATNQLVGSVSAPPYRLIWSNVPPGDYYLETRVVKTDGAEPLAPHRSVSIRPMNDNFTNRIVLTTNFAWMHHRITGSTRETDEPSHNGEPYAGSIWWSWQAPANGRVLINDPTHQGFGGVAVYSGTNLSSLQTLTNSPGSIYAYDPFVDVISNSWYQIAVTKGSRPDVNYQLRFYTPPANDHFSNRMIVSGAHVRLETHTILATREPGEPAHGGIPSDHTVWWSWTAPSSGFVSLQNVAGGSAFGGIYKGDGVSSLQQVLSFVTLSPPRTFEVTAGTTYQIGLAWYWGEIERIAVALDFTPAAANDQFAARSIIAGTNISLLADNRGASFQSGEPHPAPDASGRTLWWSWTAPTEGALYLKAFMGAQLTSGSVKLQVFTGEVLAQLEPLTFGGAVIYGGFEQPAFRVTSNQTYHIRFDTTVSIPSGVPLALDFIASPPNDKFANATALVGLNLATNGTVRGASPESHDPLVWNDAGKTVWYSWTAPQNGSVIIALTEASHFVALQAFKGSGLSNLTVAGVRQAHDSILLNATTGTTYFFALAAFNHWEPEWPDRGRFQLLVVPAEVPPNDNFAQAQELSGPAGIINATNWAASPEPDDPPLVNLRGLRRTLWYRWHAPASGLLTFTNAGSTVFPAIGIYLGTNLNQLSMIGEFESPVRARERINIIIDGASSTGGVLRVGWSLLPAPANDDYQNASPVQGTSIVLAGLVRTSTGEHATNRMRYDYRNIWWSWKAPGNGHVLVTNTLVSGPTFRIYTGATFENKQLVAGNWLRDGRELDFDAVAGTTYQIEATWGSNGDDVALRLIQHLDQPALEAHSGSVLDGFRFLVYGNVGTSCRVQYSTNLFDWHDWRQIIFSAPQEEIVDPLTTGAQMRFYRLVQD